MCLSNSVTRSRAQPREPRKHDRGPSAKDREIEDSPQKSPPVSEVIAAEHQRQNRQENPASSAGCMGRSEQQREPVGQEDRRQAPRGEPSANTQSRESR